MSIYTVNGSPLKYDNKWLATNGGSSSSDLPSYDSSDAGKALVVNSEGDGVEWQDVGSSVTVDQHYDANSENPQSGTAVAEALQTVPDELPSITGNAGKVLKVNSGATGVEWANDGSSVTVDQTYNSTSSNAQSGTAVAEAISSLATVASTGNYADLNHKPKTKVVLDNAASYSSQAFTWTLTSEQKAKVAGFANPLVTVQVSLDLGADLQENYTMDIVVHGVGDSSWYYYLPNGSTKNPKREILKGTRFIQEISTGCYGDPIDYVMCQFLERAGSPTFPSSPSCFFTLIVEECET